MILELGGNSKLKRIEVTADMFSEESMSRKVTNQATGEVAIDATDTYKAINLPFKAAKVVCAQIFGTIRKDEWTSDGCICVFRGAAIGAISAAAVEEEMVVGQRFTGFVPYATASTRKNEEIDAFSGGKTKCNLNSGSTGLIEEYTGGNENQLLISSSFDTYLSFPGADGLKSYIWYLD